MEKGEFHDTGSCRMLTRDHTLASVIFLRLRSALRILGGGIGEGAGGMARGEGVGGATRGGYGHGPVRPVTLKPGGTVPQTDPPVRSIKAPVAFMEVKPVPLCMQCMGRN